jgi:repressor LexA
MAEELSDSARLVYVAIVAHFRAFGYSPSIREICVDVGMSSPSSVYKHLNKLEEAGKIHRAGPSHRIVLGSET